MAQFAPAGRGRRVDRGLVVIEAVVGVGVVVAILGRDASPASVVFFVLCSLSAAAAGYFLVRMFTSLGDDTLDVTGEVEDIERMNLEQEKAILLQGIKEFEGDKEFGKVDEGDYTHLRRTAEARAVEIIKTLKDSERSYLERADRMIAKRLGARPDIEALDEASKKRQELQATLADLLPELDLADDAYAASAVFDDEPSDLRSGQCSTCQTPGDASANFCAGCGRPLMVEAA